ncbi:MAG: hypothetical protein KF784_14490 [Fimbriimonadaceae bacterium]|nr:hypothetical protein [Fimbriimonadaceae bacterium]
MSRARNYIIQCTEQGPPTHPQRYIPLIESHFDTTPDLNALIRRERDEFVSRWLTKMKDSDWLAPDEPSEYPMPEPTFIEKLKGGIVKKRDFIDKGLSRRAEAEKLMPRFYSRSPISFTDLGPTGEMAAGLFSEDTVAETMLWFARDRASNSMLLAYLGLEEYRSIHGGYPENLEQLSPAILKRVPGDPFNEGKPLKYIPAKNAFQLYSIGPDGVDDHASPIFVVSGSGKNYNVVQDSSKGDIVWGGE